MMLAGSFVIMIRASHVKASPMAQHKILCFSSSSPPNLLRIPLLQLPPRCCPSTSILLLHLHLDHFFLLQFHQHPRTPPRPVSSFSTTTSILLLLPIYQHSPPPHPRASSSSTSTRIHHIHQYSTPSAPPVTSSFTSPSTLLLQCAHEKSNFSVRNRLSDPRFNRPVTEASMLSVRVSVNVN